MVSSQFSGFTKGGYKPSQTHLLFPANLPDTVNTEHVELDFSDVFGPVTVDLNNIDCTTGEPVEDVNELVYDDPPVIHTRSHSLVGPSTCVSQSLKLSKLTIHETEDSLELVDYVDEETFKDIKESSFVEESLKDEDGNISKTQRVSIEDFDILKVVGQGAFAKVYQVRKKGTSEIYAMKVMRKDKIMEKNHTEYMKAERDIWTKIEHPFVVQLRYCFQVLNFEMACPFLFFLLLLSLCILHKI